MSKKNKEEKHVEVKEPKKLIALKDFKFSDGKKVYDIKKDEEIIVPEKFLQNLKTEKVIK